jgi:hypothetical protein
VDTKEAEFSEFIILAAVLDQQHEVVLALQLNKLLYNQPIFGKPNFFNT